jgi:hemerythrin
MIRIMPVRESPQTHQIASHEQTSLQPGLDASMLVGVPSIDNEHYALVFQLNRLLEQPGALPESETFTDILGKIGKHVQTHFESEEAYLMSCGMPTDEVEAHFRAHDKILEEYADLNLDLMNAKALAPADILQTIKSWIVDHVLTYDVAIRKYARAAAGR